MLNVCSNEFPKGGWTHSLPLMWRKTLLQAGFQLKKRRRGVKVRWQMILTWVTGSTYNVVIDQTSGREGNSGGGAKQSRDGSSGESDQGIGVHSKFLVWDSFDLLKGFSHASCQNHYDLKIQFWFAQITGTMYEHASSLMKISFAKESTTGKLFHDVSSLASPVRYSLF